MHEIKFDLQTGEILFEGMVICPLKKTDFLKACSLKNIKYKSVIPNQGWENISIDATINNEKFGINISYEMNRLQIVWLAWQGGFSAIKGYDASEEELIQDKNSLSKIFCGIFGKKPDEKTYNSDVFQFKWGDISIAASIRSFTVSIGLDWKF